MTDPTPKSLAHARDLLMPGLRDRDPDADLWVNNIDNTLIRAKAGTKPTIILRHAELDDLGWVELAKGRLGTCTP